MLLSIDTCQKGICRVQLIEVTCFFFKLSTDINFARAKSEALVNNTLFYEQQN